MRQKQRTWFERITAFLGHRDRHHRVCRLCHKPIKKKEHWRQVQVGWFAPVYTVEHRDCKNPLHNPAPPPDLGPELPFDLTAMPASQPMDVFDLCQWSTAHQPELESETNSGEPK